MDKDSDVPTFLLWGVDNIVYGPVDLVTLVNWVREERIVARSWIYVCEDERWLRAEEVSELKMFFGSTDHLTGTTLPLASREGPATSIKPGVLRRVKILSAFSEAQLDQFIQFMELQKVPGWAEIVTEGSPGDAMYLLLEGEVRVRLKIAGKETILATLSAGEFFGEVALFDHGVRSADVVANTDCILLRIGAGAFQKLVAEAPDLAAPFLYAMGRTLISRIRADNKRYRDSVVFARTSG